MITLMLCIMHVLEIMPKQYEVYLHNEISSWIISYLFSMLGELVNK